MRAIRLFLRLMITVLALSLTILIVGGGFWYMWQNAQGRAPEISPIITTRKIERTLQYFMYLRGREGEIVQPADLADTRQVTFIVDQGDSATTVAYKLNSAGLVKDAELFKRLLQYWGADQHIQAGIFYLSPSMTMEEIARRLQHSRVDSVWVTIPEGWRAEEIAALLQEKQLVQGDEFLAAVAQGRSDFPFLADRPAGSPSSLEGFLFPDTYEFPKITTPDRIIDIMLQNWGQRVPEALRQAAQARGMTLYEVVTLASIVEREAVLSAERPKIAGVYSNRLEIDMLLQADPTVQYAKGYDAKAEKWWNPTTLEENASLDAPYNTYLYPGLPPGPICNPGLGAIEAALQPAQHDDLFFVAKGDGSHIFAKTYEEHLANIKAVGGSLPAE